MEAIIVHWAVRTSLIADLHGRADPLLKSQRFTKDETPGLSNFYNFKKHDKLARFVHSRFEPYDILMVCLLCKFVSYAIEIILTQSIW